MPHFRVAVVWILLLTTLSAADLPAGPARQTVTTVCASCHALQVVTEQHWSETKWREIVDVMVARGADLKKDQATEVVSYLARHFGPAASTTVAPTPRNRGKELVEAICALCHELDRIRVQEFTRAEWTSEIKGMISEGAPVTDEEFDWIVDYLATNYGPKPEHPKAEPVEDKK